MKSLIVVIGLVVVGIVLVAGIVSENGLLGRGDDAIENTGGQIQEFTNDMDSTESTVGP